MLAQGKFTELEAVADEALALDPESPQTLAFRAPTPGRR